MNKQFIRRGLTLLSAVLIAAGACFISSANSDDGKETDSVNYHCDFEDGTLDELGIKTFSTVTDITKNPQITDNGIDGKSLKMFFEKTVSKNTFVFPVELKAGHNYAVTLQYKADNASDSQFLGFHNMSGAWVSEETGTAIKNQREDKENMLMYLFHTEKTLNWNTLKFKSSDVGKWSFSFSPTADQVSNSNKYFTLYFENYAMDFEDSFYIDNISIVEIPTEPSSSATYDFENGSMAGISTKVGSNLKSPEISNIKSADGSDTKALKINVHDYQNATVVFPFKMKAGATYTVSYDYRTNKDDTMTTFAFSENTYLGSANLNGNLIGKNNRFGLFIQESGNFDWNKNKISDSDWRTRQFTFTATDTQVTDEYSYFAITLCECETKSETRADKYVYIDNISIAAVTNLHIKTNYPNLEFDSVTAPAGTILDLPATDKLGYIFEGWYSDAEFRTPYTERSVLFGTEDMTLYAKYNRLSSAVVDFDGDKNYEILPVKTDGWNKDGIVETTVGKTEGTDGKETNALKIHAYNYHQAAVLLPIGLSAGDSYIVSFNYKVTAERTDFMRFSRITAADKNGNLLAHEKSFAWLNGAVDVSYSRHSNASGWETFSASFVVTEEQIANGYTTLALNLSAIESKTDDSWIYVDNISVTRVSAIYFKTDNSEIKLNPVIANPGTEINFDCLSIAGYKVAGIYTDEAFTLPYTGSSFVFGENAKTYYVKYDKTDVYEFKFENGSDVLKTNGSFSVKPDPLNTSNHVLAMPSGNLDSFTVLPFKLKKNTEYVLTFRYRASSQAVAPRLYVLAGSNTEKTPTGETADSTVKRQFSVFDVDNSNSSNNVGMTVTAPNYEWTEKTVKFKTNGEIDDNYCYLTLAGRVQHTLVKGSAEELFIDDIVFKETDATINFSVNYDGIKVDVDSLYPSMGDVVTLPKSVINPFVLEGWYFDSDFTQKAGDTITVSNKETTLYGKISKKDSVTLDFEKSSDILFSTSSWSGVGNAMITDPENPSNHIVQSFVSHFACTISARLNYQVLPNRIYKIKARYRSKVKDDLATLALTVSSITRPENGYGNTTGTQNNNLADSLVPFVTASNVSDEWTEVETTISTDQPEIDSVKKYLTLFVINRMRSDDSVPFVTMYFDDITITDIGEFDPATVTVEDATKWAQKPEDTSIWQDWSSWVKGKVENGTNDDTFDFDNDGIDVIENSNGNNSVNDNNTTVNNGNSTSGKRRKKIIKKIIVEDSGNTLAIVLSIAGAAVIAGGVITIIIVKRKNAG